VQIITVCPTLAGQEVEQLVTFPIEQSIANIPDIEETRSISRFGLSVITVVFKDKVDIYFARQLINEKLKEAEENIPKGIGKPELAPVSTGLGEVYQYIIHPKKGSEKKYNAKASSIRKKAVKKNTMQKTYAQCRIGLLLVSFSVHPELLK